MHPSPLLLTLKRRIKSPC